LECRLSVDLFGNIFSQRRHWSMSCLSGEDGSPSRGEADRKPWDDAGVERVCDCDDDLWNASSLGDANTSGGERWKVLLPKVLEDAWLPKLELCFVGKL
jgi:hypothetical protein